MTVYLVGAGPGDPGLLTMRAHEVLSRADVVLHDRLSASTLLDLAPPHAERISVGKTPRRASTPQEEINRLLVDHGRTGRTVVRLKSGDPFVFSRGGEEAEALAAAGVPFEVVPGITSAIAVPAYAGVPVTHRGLSTSFTVVTGHDAPWASSGTDWEAVARVGGTIVVMMGAATRREIAERLLAGGLPGDTPVAATQWGTRPEQRTVRTTLAGLAAADVRSPSVMVIGAVAALDLAWFERRPLFGRRVQVTGGTDVATRLRALGADVIDTPAIELLAVDFVVPDLARYDWVLVTSTNAVDRFFSQVRDARQLGAARVAAIGGATARALERWRVAPDLVASTSTAEGLLDALPEGPACALLPRAETGRAVLPDGLRARGWDVDVLPVYRTEHRAVPDAGADVIVFLSASAVDSFVDANGASTPAVVACIGPVTAERASTRGLTVSVEAPAGDVAALVDLIAAAVSRDRGAPSPDS
jgi:uroporphyrinogen III methyltransferase/synthase